MFVLQCCIEYSSGDSSGSYIYSGDPSAFRDLEFRAAMRLKLYEDAVRAKTKSTTKGDKTVDLTTRRPRSRRQARPGPQPTLS